MKKLLLMKNNLCFIKKPQSNLIAFLLLFCGLFANIISAQTTYTWIGPSGGNWGSAANWLPSGVPGGNVLDQAIIDNGGNVTLSSGTVTITKLTISNNTGPLEGSTLTINAGATLTVDGVSGVNPIVISGGNLVNNGTLVAKSGSNSGTVGMFLFGNPAVAPTSGSYTYGYTGGTGSTLDISFRSSGSGGNNSTQFLINGTNTFSKYKLVFNGSINFSMETKSSFAIRTIADTSPIIISGSGFNTANGLMLMAARTNVTVETGTTLTSNVVANIQHNTIMQNNSKLTNKGTINILGATTAHGIQIGASGTDTLLDNQGTLNVDIASSTASRAPLGVQGGSGGTLTINNSGTMTLKNTNPNTGANVGCAYLAFSSPANVNFTNNNILNLSGTNVTAGGGTTTLTNNGTIAANNAFQGLAVINNSGKTIAFVKDAATIASTNALTVGALFSTNNGILQTAAGATELSNLALVTTLSSTSSIEPGGATGKGIASFSAASVPILGTLKLQVAGNSAAGTDYDQVNNVFTDGGFDVTGATLDVTGISGTASPVDIILANGTGTITGNFASVIGLTTGWSVNYGVAGKVQLVYSALKVNESEFNQNSVTVYKNNGTLYVNSRTVGIKNIKVYDLMGRMIIDQKDVKSNSTSINNLKAINQVLIVKISGEDNTQVTKKVLF